MRVSSVTSLCDVTKLRTEAVIIIRIAIRNDSLKSVSVFFNKVKLAKHLIFPSVNSTTLVSSIYFDTFWFSVPLTVNFKFENKFTKNNQHRHLGYPSSPPASVKSLSSVHH